MEAVEHLYIELETNIRNRKAINSHALEKIKALSLDQRAEVRIDSNSPTKNSKLKPIERS